MTPEQRQEGNEEASQEDGAGRRKGKVLEQGVLLGVFKEQQGG